MPIDSKTDLFRKLPSIDELIRRPDLVALAADEGPAAVTDAARAVLASLRGEIESETLNSKTLDLALSDLDSAIERQLRRSLQYSLRTVINATGVILHTNLGRAPLSSGTLHHIRDTALTYSNLEFDLETAKRGRRDVHIDRLFRKLLDTATAHVGTPATAHVGTAAPGRPVERSSTENQDARVGTAASPATARVGTAASPATARVGTAALGRPVERSSAENAISTIVVNNNAAAVLLALNTLAEGGEVIVSRGELVEIGGSFRIPDVMAKSNAILREVGTTNRTRVQDYERAITDRTRLLLRVHRSNFQITGFTEQPELTELVSLARNRNIPLMEDLGSGALFDLRSVGITGEPAVLDSLCAGVDVVTYSGDKLLGGPQAGILSGRSHLISRMRSNSLFRALRVDKLTYAALEATLMAYLKGDHDAIPAIRMMRTSKAEIAHRADALVKHIRSPKFKVDLIDGESVIGGGAAPSAVLPTYLIAVSCEGLSADELSAKLLASNPPIVARVEEGRVLLDLRTVFPDQDQIVAAALNRLA